jgi:ATP-binding cassette subfamily B protein
VSVPPAIRPTARASMARVARLIWGLDRRALVLYLGAALVSASAIGVSLLLLRRLAEALVGGSVQLLDVAPFLALLVVQQACAAISDTYAVMLRQEVGAAINQLVQEALPAVPYSSFERTEFQAEYGMLVREASFRPSSLVDSILSGSLALFSSLAVAVALVLITPWFVLVLLGLLLPAMTAERRLRGRILDLETYHAPDLLRMQFISQSSVDPDWQRDIRASGSDVLRHEYAVLARRYLRTLRAVLARMQLVRFLASLGGLAVFVLFFAVVIDSVARRRFSPADAITLLTGGYFLSTRIRSLSASVGMTLESADFAARVFQFLDTFRPAQAADAAMATAAGGRAAPEDGETGARLALRLVGVGYTYPGVATPALQSLDYEIEPGVTAVIGANGAGKSTLVKVLAGLVMPTEGRVELVGPSGELLEPASLSRAVLFQQPAQLRLTVRQNVTMRALSSGDDEDARVWHAIEEVGLTDAVRRLPRGLDTVVGGGFGAEANLSGGQWQRLSLARVLYRHAQLVILDEPSSHLDVEAEARLLELLTGGPPDRIVVIVTHRRETLGVCDRYLELSDGRLVDAGDTPASSWMAAAGQHPYLSVPVGAAAVAAAVGPTPHGNSGNPPDEEAHQ